MFVRAGVLGVAVAALTLVGLFGDCGDEAHQARNQTVDPVSIDWVTRVGVVDGTPELVLRWTAARFAYQLEEAERQLIQQRIATEQVSIPTPFYGYGGGSGVVSSVPEAEARALACSGQYQWDCSWAVETIRCESTFHSDAHAVELDPYTGDVYEFWGLLQIWDGHRWTVAQLLDPAINIAAGYELWEAWQRGESRRPWPNCPW